MRIQLSFILCLGFSAWTILGDSSLNFTNTDPQYSANFTVDARDPNNPNLLVTLSLVNVNIANWTTDSSGKLGIYMGIGYGATSMMNADIISCYYNFYNKSTDKFSCFDLQTNAGRS